MRGVGVCLRPMADAGMQVRAGRGHEAPAGPDPVMRWFVAYSETVKPCSLPYLMLASCQSFSPSLSVVSET